ncbi:MAG TPA: CAP domain-containing protein [Planctomycetota bacterium]|nr:CAP domain-containing protein [Planctomycetota bacterium]
MLRLLLSAFLLPGLLSAQANPEAALTAEAVQKLCAYAKDTLAAGYPDRAEEIWREVLNEYDTNNAVARKALGYTQVGSSWAIDPEFRYPEYGEPTLAQAKALRKRWDKLAEELAEAHVRCAEALAAAGDENRANYHYDRALRFQPAHPKAAAVRGVQSFDGMFGSQTELAILQRSRLVRRAVKKAREMQVEVKPTSDVHEALRRAGVQVVGFAGPNVTCYGDVDPAIVEEAVRVAERALALCNAVFEGFASYRGERVIAHQCFCRTDETWLKILEANQGLLGGSSLEFLREHRPATTLNHPQRLGFMRALESSATAYDMAARWIAQSFAGFRCDALSEGIGHTIVGLLLDRNLSFSIGEDKEKGTVASRTRKLQLRIPDMQVWQDLAIDVAWENTSVPAAQLPFLKAASFPTEGRIKAWSFCHFLLLRDPELMRKLDNAPGDRVRTPYELRQSFPAMAGISIDVLDQEWRAFWTKDTPLLRAARGGEVGALEAVSEEALGWIDAFNDARRRLNEQAKGLDLPLVHWSDALSRECKLHVDYLEKHKSERGPGKEDTQDLEKEGATPRGKLMAESAVVVCGTAKPDKAIENWLLLPGYRHALLDPRLQVVGAFATKSVLVMDVERGLQPPARAISRTYPFGGQQGVPVDIDVAELGPAVRRFLEQNGAKVGKKIGFPLTLHLYGAIEGGLNPAPGHHRCELLLQGKEPVEGLVFVPTNTGPRRTHARGLAMFLPLQPLKRGASYTYQWTIGDRKEGRPMQFTTK